MSMDDIIFLRPDFFDWVSGLPGREVHMILIATKPDIIKQIPLYKELQKRGHSVILVHTGQHYDPNLSSGMLQEFGVEPDCNLQVRGFMYQVVSQIIARAGFIIQEIHARGKVVLPYVHGDTTTAMAVSNAGYCHGIASVHVEAGIRTLTPRYEGRFSLQKFDPDIATWREYLCDRANWERGSQEPYPEQFNTRSAEAATGIHLAPVDLDRDFLLAEGFASDRIFVVGNSVADATRDGLLRAKHSTIFDRYPLLATGDFVRFCVHRRENCTNEKRFRAIFQAMKELVLAGRTVLFVNMIQTKIALERFQLLEDVRLLQKQCPHFICTDVWPEYTDVIAAMSRAAVCATDSGSMQEEMNVLGIPCVTLRFGSDRAESAIAGGNLIAPPLDSALIVRMIEFAWKNSEMKHTPKLYGQNVSARCIDAVEHVLGSSSCFRSEEDRLRAF